MCTAITFKTKDHYFGRNLDLDYSYQEAVTITPRSYPLRFRNLPDMLRHYAMVGVATVADGYPLYYEATNEFGLSMAGLNFPGNAVYYAKDTQRDNVAPFEFIPWILGQCKTIQEVQGLLSRINIVACPFSESFPLSPLHWIITDSDQAITVETMAEGMRVFENPVGVLTNNPPFEFHMHRLNDFMNLTSDEPENRFSSELSLLPYSRGMGALGLPGDLSSSSRFVRAAFTKMNSWCDEGEEASVSQFFHILNAVAQQQGCVKVHGAYEKTVYSSCCNTDKGIFYYTTYGNSRITAVDMRREKLDGDKVVAYPLRNRLDLLWEN